LNDLSRIKRLHDKLEKQADKQFTVKCRECNTTHCSNIFVDELLCCICKIRVLDLLDKSNRCKICSKTHIGSDKKREPTLKIIQKPPTIYALKPPPNKKKPKRKTGDGYISDYLEKTEEK
jgi:hypothetical protein